LFEKVTEWRRRRRKQLLDDLEKIRWCWKRLWTHSKTDYVMMMMVVVVLMKMMIMLLHVCGARGIFVSYVTMKRFPLFSKRFWLALQPTRLSVPWVREDFSGDKPAGSWRSITRPTNTNIVNESKLHSLPHLYREHSNDFTLLLLLLCLYRYL
jgi:hypothetical protein